MESHEIDAEQAKIAKEKFTKAMEQVKQIEFNFLGLEDLPELVSTLPEQLQTYGKWEIEAVKIPTMFDDGKERLVEKSFNEHGSFWQQFAEKSAECLVSMDFSGMPLDQLMVVFKEIRHAMDKHEMSSMNFLRFNEVGKIIGVGRENVRHVPNDPNSENPLKKDEPDLVSNDKQRNLVPLHYTRFQLTRDLVVSKETIEDLMEDDNVWDIIIHPQEPKCIYIHFVKEPGQKTKIVQNDAANVLILLTEGIEKVPGSRELELPESANKEEGVKIYGIPNFHSFSIRTAIQTMKELLPNLPVKIEMSSNDEATITIVEN